MRVGIVGAEGAKFNADMERRTRAVIRSLLTPGDVVISGGCHLGGVDIWAVEEGRSLGLECVEYKPKRLSWKGGYEDRNRRIAADCDVLHCIVVTDYIDEYKGMKFGVCYHCVKRTGRGLDHIKSGGCWTALRAMELGKPAHWHRCSPTPGRYGPAREHLSGRKPTG